MDFVSGGTGETVVPPADMRLRGRYVRVYDPGQYLSLAEVEVWGERNLTNTNGIPATATESSQAGAGAPSRAVDGNTDGNWANNSVTHTNFEHQPWWQVDLGAVKAVGMVEIFNRTDCCGGRLQNFYVLASETPFPTNDLGSLVSNPSVISSWVSSAYEPSTQVLLYTTARYIRVQLQGDDYLSLAEVRVWGHDNLTPGKTASQSSTAHPLGSADKAIDGNPDGIWKWDATNSVTHTNFDLNAWWRVDLGPNRPSVASVQIWNRMDCCSDRLSNFVLFEPFISGGINWQFVNPAPELTTLTNFTPVYGPGRPTLDFRINRYPQYLEVQLNNQNYLSLAEVRIWGRKSVDDCAAPLNSLQHSYPDGTTGTVQDVVCGDQRMLKTTIYNGQGTALFRTIMQKPSDNGPVTLSWTWLTTGNTGYFPMPGTQRQWDASMQWQLRASIDTASMLSHTIGQTPDQAPLDTTGCTGNQWNSCDDVTLHGGCCDKHDQCFWDRHCTWKSFFGLEGKSCFDCDVDVALCFLGLPSIDDSGNIVTQPATKSKCCATAQHPDVCDKEVCGAANNETIWCNAKPCTWTFIDRQTPNNQNTCLYNCGYDQPVVELAQLGNGQYTHGCCPANSGFPQMVTAFVAPGITQTFPVCR